MPPNTIYVGRPSRFGNPINAIFFRTEEGEKLYRDWFTRGETAELIRKLLKGKNLSCWCRLDQKCHADILLEVANS